MARHGSNEAESIVVGGSGSTAATTANNNAAAVSPAEARTQGPPATKRGRYVVRAWSVSPAEANVYEADSSFFMLVSSVSRGKSRYAISRK